MINVLIGTRAQLIKMAPLILEMERRQWPLRLIFTGQHKETMANLMAEFVIATKPVLLHEGQEINGIAQVIPWFSKCLWQLLRHRSRLWARSPEGRGLVLVHGDTFSTLLGALAGRLVGLQVAHVESGLRSFNLWHPFPEELTRLAVFRLSNFAFCPDAWSKNNLKGYRVQTHETGGNTLIDALRIAWSAERRLPHELPEGRFGVVSLHRFENVFRKDRLERVLTLVEQAAEKFPLVFVLHPATRKNLEKFDLMGRLEASQMISLWPRMGYFDFVTLLRASHFVITDGGSNQEELSYMNKPTLLMRKVTERQEGIGRNVVLCEYDQGRLRAFLEGMDSGAPDVVNLEAGSPSVAIADTLGAFS